MANPYQAVESTSDASADTRSRAWLLYWLLSYLTPFALLFLLLCVFADRPLDGRTSLVLFLGPFACGLAGAVWAFKCAKLSAFHFTLFLFATIVAYGIGFVMFWILCILLFGVIAT